MTSGVVADQVKDTGATKFNTDVIERSKQLTVAVLFHAKWHPPSRQMHEAISILPTQFKNAEFCIVDADTNTKLINQENIHVYPTTVVYRFGGSIRRIQGADPPKFLAALNEVMAMETMPPQSACNRNETDVSPEEAARLDKLVNSAPIMVFIKGSKEAPFCKFSKEAVNILTQMNVAFETFDILQDRSVRDGLKNHYDWPTFPQLFVKGELIGGVDIMKMMTEDGSLAECFKMGGVQEIAKVPSATVHRGSTLDKSPSKVYDVNSALKKRLEELVNSHPLMLFMKGSPNSPKCGFSQQIVEILQLSKLDFKHFDILEDSEVREGMKTLYDWPTFPQLYAHGELIGGLDVVKELIASGGVDALKDEIEIAKKKH